MATSAQQTGLSFRKLDLHVHTPKSRCFEGTCTPEDIVTTAIKNGLAGIAVTDHNSPEWIDEVIDAAKGKPLAVFPGVEVSCTGGKKSIHIIGLFDVGKRAEKVKVLLNVLGITSDYGKEGTLTNKTPIDVIDEIHKLGGIAVLAHANSDNGVLSDMEGQARTRVIKHSRLLAVEATDFSDDEKKKKKHKRVVDLLNGNDPTGELVKWCRPFRGGNFRPRPCVARIV
jgi:DNA polymerase III alpha subunit